VQRSWLTLCARALALGACQTGPGATPSAGSDATGANSAQAAAADGAAVAPVPPPELGEFRVVSVLLGTALDADGIVVGDRESFAGGDRIQATVLSTGAHPGLSLSARWLAPEGVPIAESAQALAPAGPTATTFTLSNPAGWPAGDYQVIVAANGYPLQTRRFQVAAP
jgi:hypothetical protein